MADALRDPDLPGWKRPEPTTQDLRQDLLLAVVLFAASVVSMGLGRATRLYEHPANGLVSIALLAAVTMPLVWRRRHPAIVVVVVSMGFGASQQVGVTEAVVIGIAEFMAFYSLGAWGMDRRRALMVRVIVVALIAMWFLYWVFRSVTGVDDLGLDRSGGAFSPLAAFIVEQSLVTAAYFVAAWGFGDHAWEAARDRARAEHRAQQLVREQVKAERAAVALDRLSIARELHDVVAHHVATMGVQAGAARSLIGAGDVDQALVMVDGVAASARRAVGDMGQLLGTLRSDTDADHEVGAGVDRLATLVDEVRATGAAVTFEQVGEVAQLPDLVSLTLYRIAQEALTNTRKHAGPSARSTVRLRYLEDEIEVEVADDGAGRGSAPVPSTGLGLVGMRERVDALGGELEAGHRPRGGFLVRARIPVEVGA